VAGVAAGLSGAGAALFIALVSLATAAAAPYPQVLGLAAEGVLVAAVVASLSSWLLGRSVAYALSVAARSADEAYREKRTTMSHAERVAAVETVATLAASSAVAKRVETLWGLAAATGGVGALYAAVLGYRLLWDCARRRLGQAPAPTPGAAYAALLASLGLAAPLAAGWARRLAEACTAAPRRGSRQPTEAGPEAEPAREQGEEGQSDDDSDGQGGSLRH